MYNVAVRRVLVTLFAVDKQISITYSECVYVTLVVQHGMRMRHIKIAICVLYFSILFQKQRDFRKRKSVEQKCCVLISPEFLSETFLTLRRTE
jgi:hypothetical protein